MSLFSEIIIKSENEMEKLGNFLSKIFKPYDIITLNGDVGVGKTFLSKSIIYNITKIKEVPSPTFNLVNEYQIKDLLVKHYDLFRLKNKEETRNIGLFENYSNVLTLIEWPEKIFNAPNNKIELFFEYKEKFEKRFLSINGIKINS